MSIKHGTRWHKRANDILRETERLENREPANRFYTVWRDKKHYAKLIGVSEMTAYRYLEELVRMNHLRSRKGPASFGYWYYMEYRLAEDWNPRTSNTGVTF